MSCFGPRAKGVTGVKAGSDTPFTPYGFMAKGVTVLGSVTPYSSLPRYLIRGVMGSDVSIDITPSLPNRPVFTPWKKKPSSLPVWGVMA